MATVSFTVSVPGAVLGVGFVLGSHGVATAGPPVVPPGGMLISTLEFMGLTMAAPIVATV